MFNVFSDIMKKIRHFAITLWYIK